MFKKAKLILIATLLLSGCSAMNNESKKDTNTDTNTETNTEIKSVPEEMEAS
ncbi:TPA: hypothetical protein OWB69_002734, partial [Staphylococcus aureus]|nr:hypothetical protein [Staphylococcus aureus]